MSEKPESLDTESEETVDERRQVWAAARLGQFLLGEISLGELESLDKETQYKLAEMGFRFLQQGKLERAKQVFEGLVALDPRDAYFHLILGSIEQRCGHLEEADRWYTRSLTINPYSASALANRGEVRVLRGMLRAGVRDLLGAIDEDPKGKEPATRRAQVLLPNLKKKLEELDQVAGSEPSEAVTDDEVSVVDPADQQTDHQVPKFKRPEPELEASLDAPTTMVDEEAPPEVVETVARAPRRRRKTVPEGRKGPGKSK